MQLTTVGASLLAMDVNDYACLLDKRSALESIVGIPPGASSLLHIPARAKGYQTYGFALPRSVNKPVSSGPTCLLHIERQRLDN
jgi:hypothetical protein